MTIDDDRSFYEKRLRDTLELADNAVDPSIAHIHRVFAKHYARVLAKLPKPTDEGSHYH